MFNGDARVGSALGRNSEALLDGVSVALAVGIIDIGDRTGGSFLAAVVETTAKRRRSERLSEISQGLSVSNRRRRRSVRILLCLPHQKRAIHEPQRICGSNAQRPNLDRAGRLVAA